MRVPRTVRKKSIRPSVVALLGAVLLVLVGACGETAAAPANAPNSTSALDSSRPYGGDLAAEGTPVSGGTLTVGMQSESASLDPTVGSAREAASAIYDSLLKLDERSQPQPYLAESMTTTDDGRTWLLRLRPGVTFHDGTPLDAAAVIFNVQRHIDKKASPGHLYTESIGSMTAVDDLTVRFDLTRPNGSFPLAFALPFNQGNLGAIASPAAVKQWGDDYGRHPVGAGPFQFVEWIPDTRIVLKKFDRYWQPGLPYLDEVLFRPIPDTDSRSASIANGDVDLIYAGYHIEILRASEDPNLDVYYGQGGGGQYLNLNVNEAPFDDRRMREAVTRAIDLKALAATQFRGFMDEARTAFPPDSPFFSQEASDEYPAYDLDAAKRLIEEYRADGGNPDFTLSTSSASNNVALATFLQAQWAAAGLTVQLDFSDLAAFKQVAISGKFQASTTVLGPWDGPYPSMAAMYHTGGSTNYGRYSNPEVDAALDEAEGATDADQQIAAYQRAQAIAGQDIPFVWLARGYLGTVARKNVHGVVRYLSREMFYATLWRDR
ncbi:ABC transporter substrate-binding protein [Pseudonocardia yunnanensis]|uniref:ABC transporter substrate-binding protein n=1 Tax=Pseudonocardia yunnanensis TaxID=58107 RepID=A0ABW4F7U3_9PSEU